MRPITALPPRWTPPLGSTDLERILRQVRDWEPVDWDGVFDDLASVLSDDVGHHALAEVPDPQRMHQLARRFRGAHAQLVNRARRDDVPERYPDAGELIAQARALDAQEIPTDPWQALGYLRRLGWATLELVEILEEIGCIEDVVEC